MYVDEGLRVEAGGAVRRLVAAGDPPGLWRAEIAETLPIAPATVGTHMKRAYAALRNALLKQRYFPPHSIDAELHEIFVAMNDRAKAARARARRPVTSGHPATDGSLTRSGDAS